MLHWAWGLQGTIETNVSTTCEQDRKMLLILHKPHNITVIIYLKHIRNILCIKVITRIIYITHLKHKMLLILHKPHNISKTHNTHNIHNISKTHWKHNIHKAPTLHKIPKKLLKHITNITRRAGVGRPGRRTPKDGRAPGVPGDGRARARLRNVTVVVHKVWRRRSQVIAWIR